MTFKRCNNKKPSKHCCYVVIFLLSLISCYFLLNFDEKSFFKNDFFAVEANKLQSGVKRPKILIWAKQYNPGQWTLEPLPNGEVGCELTFNRKELTESDAVVFFMKTTVKKDLPPTNLRRRNQTYVWWCHESPWTVLHYYGHNLKDFNNYFNWTMTYKHDSDVLAQLAPVSFLDYFLYRLNRSDGAIKRNIVKTSNLLSKSKYELQFQRLLAQKTKFAVWLVSDCSVVNGAKMRMSVVKQMKSEASLQIDEFGKCSGREIPQNTTILFETLQPYKFYIAFENSYHCNDYFTEKIFYNSFVANLVPVIYGPRKEDVLKITPPNSFIHFEDFENISELAKYLKYLDSNDSAYQKYFDWWMSPGAHVIPRYGFNYGSDHNDWDKTLWTTEIQDDMIEHQRMGFYHLCRKLRNKEHMKTTKVISNLHQSYFGSESFECLEKVENDTNCFVVGIVVFSFLLGIQVLIYFCRLKCIR